MTAAPGILDCEGLNCPLPVLKARKALRGLPPGAHLVIRATDPMAAIDIPHMCHEDGHTLLGQETAGPLLIFTVARG